jgi:hypothetical protein
MAISPSWLCERTGGNQWRVILRPIVEEPMVARGTDCPDDLNRTEDCADHSEFESEPERFLISGDFCRFVRSMQSPRFRQFDSDTCSDCVARNDRGAFQAAAARAFEFFGCFCARRRVLLSFSTGFARGSGCFRLFQAGNVCGKLCRGGFRPDLSAARRVLGRFRPENREARLVLGDFGWKKSEVDRCRRRIRAKKSTASAVRA